MKHKKLTAAAAAVTAVSSAAMPASADWVQIGWMGDLNGDKEINAADLVLLSKHLLAQDKLTDENFYKVEGRYVGINGGDGFLPGEYLVTADVNQDSRVDAFDLVLLRQHIVRGYGYGVWEWEDTPQETTTAAAETTATTVTSTATVTQPTVTTTIVSYTPETTTEEVITDFITAPIYDLYGSLPSQDEANLLIFYVDFPDCKYDYDPSVSEIESYAFGAENTSDSNYPFDSMSAFYSRSSKGAMKLQGDAFRYTTKQNKSTYENDAWHVALIDEIVNEYKNRIDFSKYDADGDKMVDSILISVPTAAGEDNWWPAAGQYGGENSQINSDISLGHVIVGNAQIESASDHSNFVSSYLHEMGHCMGLPDYYLYGVDDFQGLHGSAGFEMMDDAISDFGALSKLMLGWYRQDQISVYDSSLGTQTYTLVNSEKDGGNCVIVPCGDLADKYRSEFFIIEYTTMDGNNSGLKSEWWRKTGSGVRIFHAEASNNGNRWYNYWKYASGEDSNTNNNNGRRFIRLVGEGTDDTDNLLRTGAVVDGSTGGFQWYDSSGNLTVDPGISITVDAQSGDSYTITISQK